MEFTIIGDENENYMKIIYTDMDHIYMEKAHHKFIIIIIIIIILTSWDGACRL